MSALEEATLISRTLRQVKMSLDIDIRPCGSELEISMYVSKDGNLVYECRTVSADTKAIDEFVSLELDVLRKVLLHHGIHLPNWQSPRYYVDAQVDGECKVCVHNLENTSWFVPHYTMNTCEQAGKKTHCTCDKCW